MSLSPALSSSLRIAQGYPVSACTQVSATSITSPAYGPSPAHKLFAFVGGFTCTFDSSSLTNSFTGGNVTWTLITSGTTASESWGIYQGNVVGIPVGTTTCSGGGLATSVYLSILGFESCTGYGWFTNGSGTGTTPTFTATPQTAGSMLLAMVNDGHGSSLRTSTSTQIVDTAKNPGDNDSYWIEAPQEWFKAPGTYTYGAASPAPGSAFAYVAIEILASPVVDPAEFLYPILAGGVAPGTAFQWNAFQDNAFQIFGNAVSTAFQPDAFQDSAFQVYGGRVGLTYNESESESALAQDVLQTAQGFAQPDSYSALAQDVLLTAGGLNASQAESALAQDVLLTAQGFATPFSESALAQETLATAEGLNASEAESALAQDQSATAEAMLAALSESALAQDTALPAMQMPVSLLEGGLADVLFDSTLIHPGTGTQYDESLIESCLAREAMATALGSGSGVEAKIGGAGTSITNIFVFDD